MSTLAEKDVHLDTASIIKRFVEIRERSEAICAPLNAEDYVVQPITDVSPPKWHLAHTSWFFETFLLKAYLPNYQDFHPEFNFLFNSYYESIGKRTLRTDRGNLTRPTVKEVYAYRKHVTEHIQQLLTRVTEQNERLFTLLELGMQHEQQHQELLATDIKYILGHNPLFPALKAGLFTENKPIATADNTAIKVEEGVYEIGFRGTGFCFDNELGVHRVFLEEFELSPHLVTNGEYLNFIAEKGYADFRHWLAEGWDWVKLNNVQAPMHWHFIDGAWHQYTLSGLQPLHLDAPVTHVSFYEAEAFANWSGKRLPTEFEWEVASPQLDHGHRWEWTGSSYRPYPRYTKEEGAVGEYNGKFMINQMVLRGGSIASPPGHVRPTYRNFFHPHLQWQFTGIRLVK